MKSSLILSLEWKICVSTVLFQVVEKVVLHRKKELPSNCNSLIGQECWTVCKVSFEIRKAKAILNKTSVVQMG